MAVIKKKTSAKKRPESKQETLNVNVEVVSDTGEEITLTPAQVAHINEAVLQIADLKYESESANAKYSDAKKKHLEYLEEHGVKSVTLTSPDTKARSTVVRGETTVYDVEKLKKKLGSQMWNKVTSRTLDEKKLASYVTNGDIPSELVAECIERKPRAPYVLVTF